MNLDLNRSKILFHKLGDGQWLKETPGKEKNLMYGNKALKSIIWAILVTILLQLMLLQMPKIIHIEFYILISRNLDYQKIIGIRDWKNQKLKLISHTWLKLPYFLVLMKSGPKTNLKK